MIQVQIPEDGAMLDFASGPVWVSPQRDIVQAYGTYIEKALRLSVNLNNPVVASYYNRGGSEDQLRALSVALANYHRSVLEYGQEKTAQELADVAATEGSCDRETLMLFGYCLMCVILGAFHGGMRDMRGKTPAPYLAHLDPDFTPTLTGWRGWFKRLVLKLLTKLH